MRALVSYLFLALAVRRGKKYIIFLRVGVRGHLRCEWVVGMGLWCDGAEHGRFEWARCATRLPPARREGSEQRCEHRPLGVPDKARNHHHGAAARLKQRTGLLRSSARDLRRDLVGGGQGADDGRAEVAEGKAEAPAASETFGGAIVEVERRAPR